MTFAEMVEEYACQDWRGMIARHECDEEDPPSIGALEWIHDFAGQCDAAGITPPDFIDYMCNGAIEATWGEAGSDRNRVDLVVRRTPDEWGPYIYNRFMHQIYKGSDETEGYKVTPEFLAWALKEYH